jgi:hypothetical protein
MVDMADDDKLPEITPEMLAAVTGGAGSNDDVTLMLQTLMSSIQDLAKSRQSDGGFGQMMPMMMMMMMQRQQAPAAPVVAAAEPPPGDGWIKVT